MIMLFKVRSILKGVFSINANKLLINSNDLRLAFGLKIIRLAHVLFELGPLIQIIMTNLSCLPVIYAVRSPAFQCHQCSKQSHPSHLVSSSVARSASALLASQ